MPACVSWQIYFKKKKTGGISFNSTVALTHIDEKLCYQILHEYKIHNAEVPRNICIQLKYNEVTVCIFYYKKKINSAFANLVSEFPWCLAFLQLLFREDATVDDLIDVIEGNRKYMKCVYVYNKIDVVGIDDVDKLARQPNSIVISCNLKAGFYSFSPLSSMSFSPFIYSPIIIQI